ncbi:N-acetylglucosamine-1-phosphotransferase subunit gamma-like [Penaeus chinensis]|uniref:N-acetylglucosamine-1-phosphotransferase subunit gamma-like n=1 Tax=Penaeus chinensis TaxID=139456 RepID=UPI001FB6B721|nr:N-acetylglucosamine-1-phosphotransferase subunit gamma-like [Penaeus chinensis]
MDKIAILHTFMCYAMTVGVRSEMVQLRVINEMPNNGYSNLNGLDAKTEERLQARMKPANVSGPDHLYHLEGKCFKYKDLKYEYMFCPFNNITQEDIQAFYEPYKGILGVWLDWEIRDNKFAAMRMVEGSSCGMHNHRTTKVEIVCGVRSELLSVSEPEKCRYLAKFMTPEVCGENAMVVYPRLSSELRHQWDALETDRSYGDITEKGYQKELDRIMMAAGYVVSPEVQSSLLEKASAEKKKSCRDELEEARQRISELEEELKMKEEIIVELEGKVN